MLCRLTEYILNHPDDTLSISEIPNRNNIQLSNRYHNKTRLSFLILPSSALRKSEIRACPLSTSAHVQRVGLFWDAVVKWVSGFPFAGSLSLSHKPSWASFWKHFYTTHRYRNRHTHRALSCGLPRIRFLLPSKADLLLPQNTLYHLLCLPISIFALSLKPDLRSHRVLPFYTLTMILNFYNRARIRMSATDGSQH